MPKDNIPNEWVLGATRRYKRQNMERAMRGKIERGLVELITNSDDSYRDLEDIGKQVSGKIRIEVERRKKGQSNTVIVRDRAGGMNRAEIYKKLGELGKRTSGFEKGKARRGLHGRGARDVAAFGTVHYESIKEGEYNHLIIPPSLTCSFKEPSKKATQEVRKNLGIPKGNGTVVTIEVEKRFKIPQHGKTLLENFHRYYSLRDILSNPARKVTIVDLNKDREDPLIYRFSEGGEVVFDDKIIVPDYPDGVAHLVICKHSDFFEQDTLPYREGVLVKSAAAIHDCTYFGLEAEPFSWRFTGKLRCEFIDKLVREYDDREDANPDNPNHPENNPTRLLDPSRDGLIFEHPFVQALYKKCKQKLKPFIEELKAAEEPHKRDVTDDNLDKKLNNLSKEISKVFEKKVKEFEEEIPPELTDEPPIKGLPIGLHIIPREEIAIITNQPKTFSIIVKHYEALEASLPVNIISSDPEDVKVRISPVFLKKFLEDGKVGRTTFTVESSKVGTEAFIEARYGGYDNLVLVKVVKPPSLPELPEGFFFEKPLYHLRINKEKTLNLRLKTSTKLNSQAIVEITSDHPEIVIKGGGRFELRETKELGVLIGKCKILGRQLNAKGEITARVEGFKSAKTHVIVEERSVGGGLKFDPVEEHFGSVRYKWEGSLLKIGAKHPSIRKYLGIPTEEGYPGKKSPLYHSVLAEVIAEALAFRILEIQFKREGQEGMLDYVSTDTYYHKHFSEFLTITHKNLVTESI
jgi:hypothetical protein